MDHGNRRTIEPPCQRPGSSQPGAAGDPPASACSSEGETTPADGPPLPRRPIEQDAPLSFAQTALWFLQQLAPESSAYQECLAVSLRGVLQVEALVQAIRQMMERHEVLRSTFPLREGQVVQASDRPQQFSVPLSDLSHLSTEERETAVLATISEESQRPFDLTAEPPCGRAAACAGAGSTWLIILHRMISDQLVQPTFGARTGCALRCVGCRASLSPARLPIHYADYAHWQRQRLESGALAAELTYWKERLEGPLPLLDLPIDRPRSGSQTSRGPAPPVEHSLALVAIPTGYQSAGGHDALYDAPDNLHGALVLLFAPG